MLNKPREMYRIKSRNIEWSLDIIDTPKGDALKGDTTKGDALKGDTTKGDNSKVLKIEAEVIANNELFRAEITNDSLKVLTDSLFDDIQDLFNFLQRILKSETNDKALMYETVIQGEKIKMQCYYVTEFRKFSFSINLCKQELDQVHRLERLVEKLLRRDTCGDTHTVPITLVNGWAHYGDAYGPANCAIQGNLCIVSGLIRGNNWGHCAILPDNCRPSSRLIFNCNNHNGSMRIDVLPNGEIHWVTGSKDHNWISLSGINFVIAEGSPLSLTSGKRNYGGKYAPAQFKKVGDLCIVSGLVSGDKTEWGHIATLPGDCRPSHRHIFNCNTHEGIARVDVLSNGNIVYVTGDIPHDWISLSGINFVCS